MAIILSVLLVLAILCIKPILSNLGEMGTFARSQACEPHLFQTQQRTEVAVEPCSVP